MIAEKTIGGFTVGGQPTDDDLAALKARGITTVVNVRMPGETDVDERAKVEALGMTYVSVPFTFDSLAGEHIERIRAELGDTAPESVLIH
jgi:protein tyrosine phosphatase (PTP) superfamily phosphohydrolase (DUF442 family)